MEGMTIKQMNQRRFVELCHAYRAAKASKDNAEFVRLSLAIHAAKGTVPKRMWRLINAA